MKITKDNSLQYSSRTRHSFQRETTKYFPSIQNIFDYFPPCIQRIKNNFISPSGRQLGLINPQIKDTKDLN